MSHPGTIPLLVDTGAFYAYYDGSASRHDRACTVFEAIAGDVTRYRPRYTTTHVLAELATLLMRKRDRATAARGLRRIRESPTFTVVRPTSREFEVACEQFERYGDQQITLVDHVTAAIADARDVEYVFAFDDDFRTLGLTLVPDDVRIPDHS